MTTTDLLLIGVAGVGLYLIFGKTQTPVAATPVTSPVPYPSNSPYWGYPPNLMNTSPSANNGQSWSTENTTATINALAGLGTAAIQTWG